ncbi:MAG: sulfotransferase [Deltaproteobacteria bacterium]|nr:sulfotransferase [Deltaproteobacteria bacterium]
MSAPAPAPPRGQPRSPDFVCVGTQKGGTTWLHHVMAHHPGFWLPPFKELDFFLDPRANLSWKLQAWHTQLSREVAKKSVDLEILRWYSRLCLDERMDLAWYRQLFAPAGPRICGEVSPNYAAMGPAQAAQVKAACPNAKIIVMLRDPVDRIWSMVRMMHRAGHIPRVDGPEAAALALAPDALKMSDYSQLLATWEGAFGPDRVLILWYPRLEADPLAVVAQLCGTFGVPFRPDSVRSLAEKRYNDAPAADLPPELGKQLALRLAPATMALARRFPAEAGPWAERLGRMARG